MNQKTPLNISAKDLNKWLFSEDPKPILLDVRESNELAIASFPHEVIHLPLSDSLRWEATFSKSLSFQIPIVVICHSGIRSWNFGVWLLEQDCRYQVWNLQGGIDSWSKDVDLSVPRY